jgi:hypothetical protein
VLPWTCGTLLYFVIYGDVSSTLGISCLTNSSEAAYSQMWCRPSLPCICLYLVTAPRVTTLLSKDIEWFVLTNMLTYYLFRYAEQFNAATAENECKWAATQPQQGIFSFDGRAQWQNLNDFYTNSRL